VTHARQNIVMSIRAGQHTANDVVGWFGPPTATAPIGNGAMVLTWSRGPEALSVAVGGDGRVLSIASAGGPPW